MKDGASDGVTMIATRVTDTVPTAAGRVGRRHPRSMPTRQIGVRRWRTEKSNIGRQVLLDSAPHPLPTAIETRTVAIATIDTADWWIAVHLLRDYLLDTITNDESEKTSENDSTELVATLEAREMN